MKVRAIEKILGILQEGTETAIDIFDVMSSGYRESYGKMRRQMQGGGFHFKTDWAAAYRDEQAFYSLLNKLKREGLVVKKKEGRNAFWHLTKQGRERLGFLRKKRVFSAENISYRKVSSPSLVLVTFDLPAKEPQKRAWLHGALRALDFSLFQQSVWMGKNKIPEEFVRDLRERDMLRQVHILEITRQGTVARLDSA